MKSYELPFATIIIHRTDLAEVIINEGVVLNELMVEAYHDFLLTYLQAPFALLINIKYSYSYTFEAQRAIANLKEISHMAIVVGTNGALKSTETLIELNEGKSWNVKLFHDKEVTLNGINNSVANILLYLLLQLFAFTNRFY